MPSPSPPANPDSRLQTIYQFPNITWVENIAVRSNGKLLVTLITSPEVWEIDPFLKTGQLIYHFPHVTSAFGIAEIAPDVFAVALGNYSTATAHPVPGTYAVWKIAFGRSNQHSYSSGPSPSKPKISKIAAIPDAQILNGMCTLPSQQHSILLADSFGGQIFRLDTLTGTPSLWAAGDPLFQGNASAPIPLGINGLQHLPSSYSYSDKEPSIYFTNSFATPVLGRVRINATTGAAILPAEIVVAKPSYPTNGGVQADDFIFDATGQNAYVSTDPSDSVVKISLGKKTKQRVVAGGLNDAAIAGNTAVKFGRTEKDRETLYITTNGGLASPPPSGVVGGKVVSFDTRGL